MGILRRNVSFFTFNTTNVRPGSEVRPRTLYRGGSGMGSRRIHVSRHIHNWTGTFKVGVDKD